MASSTVNGRKRARYERDGYLENFGDSPIDRAFNQLIEDVKNPRYRVKLWLRMKWARIRRRPPLVRVSPREVRLPLLAIEIQWPRYRKLREEVADLRRDVRLLKDQCARSI